MRFEEHYAITASGIEVEKAAWVCGNPRCLHEEFVRGADRGVK
jgi:hypothetical protein